MEPRLPKPPAETLSPEEQQTYQWQMWTQGIGEQGQRRLKNSTVLISRCGGLGSVVAYELAAAGVGRLILAHGGNVKPSDLNRQLLMTHSWLGKPRVESAERRLKELNPRIDIVKINANLDDRLANQWVPQSDVCVGAAPLFEERFSMSDACVLHQRPLVDCAMFDMEASVTTYPPGGNPCLRCVTPEIPEFWKREFPVFGATSGTVGCLGALEAIKLITGVGKPLFDRTLRMDLREMTFREFSLAGVERCSHCQEKQTVV
ncbi:MAG: HesA/MoeB/ThiF family protein [Planctomycetota bacterium]|nr:HesA/MoeB/ThiF family protein [Planctomycetota bacterium]